MNFQLSDLKKLQQGYLILTMYGFLMIITATIGWYMDNKNGFTTGYIVGTVISFVLWFTMGKKMAKV